jgi:hypothetical protein
MAHRHWQTVAVTAQPTRLPHAGDVIVRADLLGTAMFVVTAVVAAASFSTTSQWVGAVTAMTLFFLGVLAFLWAFYNAVQRSRSEQVSVTQLFLLLGNVAPARVRRTMLALLLVQCLTALVTTFARPNGPDGSPGSSLAVGFLVPMFGFGLNGLWAAYHGRFAPRDDEEAVAARRAAAAGSRSSGADAQHSDRQE